MKKFGLLLILKILKGKCPSCMLFSLVQDHSLTCILMLFYVPNAWPRYPCLHCHHDFHIK